MSQANVEIVTRAITAAIARPKPDYSTMNELYSPDHVLVPAGAASGLEQEAVGAEGFRRWQQDIEDSLPTEFEFQGAVDVGPHKVLLVVSARFKGKASGAAAEQRLWSVVTVRGGQIVRTESFTEPVKALRAAGGLSE